MPVFMLVLMNCSDCIKFFKVCIIESTMSLLSFITGGFTFLRTEVIGNFKPSYSGSRCSAAASILSIFNLAGKGELSTDKKVNK